MYSNLFEVTKINNGWLLCLPVMPKADFDADAILKMGKEMGKAVRGKDIMDELQNEEENEEKKVNYNVFIKNELAYFKTLPELLDFITFEFGALDK